MIIHSNNSLYNASPLATARRGKQARRAGDKDTSSVSNETQLEASGNNDLTVDSPIQDVNAANAIAEQMRRSILGQPGAAMLAQARLIPQKALQLLQQ